MATTADPPETPVTPGSARATAPVETASTPPIRLFAVLGGVLMVFIVWVMARWITGPYFKTVPAGPDKAPGWMMFALHAFEFGGLPLAAFVIYRCVIRPWRRDGRPSTDGLLVIAFATVWFQDPFSTYYVNWFAYNKYLINFGSWVHDIPGWIAPGKPGNMFAEPIVFIGPSYVYFLTASVIFGTWVMRRSKARRPSLQGYQLLLICFVAMCAVDFVAEGLIWMPLGFWAYPGGHGILFPSTYHKFAVEEMVPIGLMFTGLSALRYYRDDRGYTFAERGAERLNISRRRVNLMRVLAVIFAVQAITFVCYSVPAAWSVTHQRPWPKDTLDRSYFTNGLCVGNGRACTGPSTPIASNSTAYLTTSGTLAFPAGVKAPARFR
jgi:hypothetical protein